MYDLNELISRAGGVKQLAEHLGYMGRGGYQRVYAWKKQGIPILAQKAFSSEFARLMRRNPRI